MVKNSMDSSLGVSLTVSAVCCPVEAGEDPAGIARYVQAVLEPVFPPAEALESVPPEQAARESSMARDRTEETSFFILNSS